MIAHIWVPVFTIFFGLFCKAVLGSYSNPTDLICSSFGMVFIYPLDVGKCICIGLLGHIYIVHIKHIIHSKDTEEMVETQYMYRVIG